jgi:hypothetical protein
VNIVAHMMRALVDLFVDDGTLALTLIVVLATVGTLAHVSAIGEAFALAILVAGTLGALLVNVIRAASATKR